MLEKILSLFAFRELRALERLGEAFCALPQLLFHGKLKQLGCTFMAITELLGTILFALPQTPRGQHINPDEWTLVWSDEFDGDALDPSKWAVTWNYVRRGGIWHDDQVRVSDGALRIRTEYKDTPEFGPGWYSSEISSKNLFEKKYGYYEVRCICPGGNGLWAAFWMLSEGMFEPPTGNAANGCEIDIFESGFHGASKKKLRNAVNQAAGFDGYTSGISQGQILGHYLGENIYKQYNTYGLEWNENEIIWYINGVETDRMTGKWVPQVAQYLLLSVEVAGNDGNPGVGGDGVPFEDENGSIESNDPSIFPLDFIVDYVRVYDRKP